MKDKYRLNLKDDEIERVISSETFDTDKLVE